MNDIATLSLWDVCVQSIYIMLQSVILYPYSVLTSSMQSATKLILSQTALNWFSAVECNTVCFIKR